MSKHFQTHIKTLCAHADAALAKGGFDHLLVASGVEKYAFLDDRVYPFKVNPQFKWWAPLTQHPHSWVSYTPGKKPVLIYFQPDDYWHTPPQAPSGFWVEQFDIRIITEAAQAADHLPKSGKSAIIAESDAGLNGFEPNNPKAVIDYLHYQRAYKTEYELDCMRRASTVAVKAHIAARKAFHDGGSELEIHRAYLAASGHNDLNLPYGNIVALNEHGATLHYQYQAAQCPKQHLSFLIDAGAEVDGYAADITRTWSKEPGLFADLINAVDKEQIALANLVKDGSDYKQLHLECHLRLAGILSNLQIVNMDPANMVASGVTATFFPHGLGHLIGLQVHDVAGRQDIDGVPIARPEGHPFLRLTRELAPGMAVTIEPGIYFIETLLNKLKNSNHAKSVNWDRIDELRPYGGVRIEDDVVCTSGAPENLTRDAFKAAGE